MISKRTWSAIIILGFLGSLAWGVENQFFNTFIYNNITPDPRPISWMVAASAITATLALILFGIHTILDGKEAFIPTSLIFQVAAVATLFAALPIFTTVKPVTVLNSE